MDELFGSGEYTYRYAEGWGKLPAGMKLGEVAAVGVDRTDRVFVFNRGPHPMVVFDAAGNFLRSWGEGIFSRPHGIHIAPNDTVFCTDDGDHTVRQCTLDGKVLLRLGTPGTPAPFMSGRPFHRCTHTALSPAGDIFVTDGYGNAQVHKFNPKGRLLHSWGEPGSGPGQFNLPHNICCDGDGWLYVADRENHRIQVFDTDGRYETQINNLHRPSALCLSGGRCPICYVGEIGPYMDVNRKTPNLGPRVSIITLDGKLLARIGTTPAAGTGPGQFTSPHGIAINSKGDIYIGEVGRTAWPSLFPGESWPEDQTCLKKYERIRAVASLPTAAR
jgi:DNA-binding beta-propeller fold protein YncE